MIYFFPGANWFWQDGRDVLGIWISWCGAGHCDHGQGNRQRIPSRRRRNHANYRRVFGPGAAFQYLRWKPHRLRHWSGCAQGMPKRILKIFVHYFSALNTTDVVRVSPLLHFANTNRPKCSLIISSLGKAKDFDCASTFERPPAP